MRLRFIPGVKAARAVNKLRRIAPVVAAVSLLSFSLCLAAEPSLTLGHFQHPKTAKDLEVNKAYLMGAADGLIAYNMRQQDKDKLFCPPGLLPKISFEQASEAVMRWSRKTSGSADLPLGLALLYGLTNAYPCR
jgi:Rap1a immunity proteins